MSQSTQGFYPAVVRRIARGEGPNPDTLILLERPAILIKSGVRLRLYTREYSTYTHLAWAEVESTRVIEKDEVEFVLQYGTWCEDRSHVAKHLLLAKRDQTDMGWKWKRAVPWIVAWWRSRGSNSTQIPRYIPPTPPPSSPTSPSASASSLTWPDSIEPPTTRPGSDAEEAGPLGAGAHTLPNTEEEESRPERTEE
ncbi:hypothetical protein K466DRAFT_604564 [Polyporus arcularius HHB13444]|uniref:Uncharacterized protein n=1 Tax=Polyporus arcularius HHB13444 TaxID=1314778 RepID=A0A5C3NVG4_9APHY|nr:hypothetical protein K466DRAFT_604564 [Polyporus arcularius HHB13444]